MLLERAHEGVLVRGCLEATVTKLGAGIDELQLDVLECPSLGVNQERLSQGENPLLGSNATTLDHDEVLFDLSVVRESSHGVDGLIGQIVIGGGVVLHQLQENKT